MLLIGALSSGCSSIRIIPPARTVEPVSLDRLSRDPTRYYGHKVAVGGLLRMGSEGDELCNGPGNDESDGCIAIQRSGIFKKRRSDYFGRLNERQVTFTAELVATPPSPPASCPPNQECNDAGHKPPFELRVLSPIQVP
jgi:hypothetical protein